VGGLYWDYTADSRGWGWGEKYSSNLK
jgi:hypothetical protein